MDIEASAPRSPRAAFTIVADAGGMIPSSRAERNRHTPHYASSPQRNDYTGVPPQRQPASQPTSLSRARWSQNAWRLCRH